MLPLDPSTTNLILTVAVGGMFVFFIILLMKLKPSTDERKDIKTEIEVERKKPPQTRHTAPQTPQAIEVEVPRVAEKPLVTVSSTVTESSIQTKQGLATSEKTVAPAKTKSLSFSSDCLHHFGYLRTLPRNSPLPDECLGCKKIVACFVNKEST